MYLIKKEATYAVVYMIVPYSSLFQYFFIILLLSLLSSVGVVTLK